MMIPCTETRNPLSQQSIALVDLGKAVAQTVEFSQSSALADVGGKTGSGEVKGVDEAEGGSSGSTTRCKVSSKVISRTAFSCQLSSWRPAWTYPWMRSLELGWGSTWRHLARFSMQVDHSTNSTNNFQRCMKFTRFWERVVIVKHV